jgi:hypothetical protein
MSGRLSWAADNRAGRMLFSLRLHSGGAVPIQAAEQLNEAVAMHSGPITSQQCLHQG